MFSKVYFTLLGSKDMLFVLPLLTHHVLSFVLLPIFGQQLNHTTNKLHLSSSASDPRPPFSGVSQSKRSELHEKTYQGLFKVKQTALVGILLCCCIGFTPQIYALCSRCCVWANLKYPFKACEEVEEGTRIWWAMSSWWASSSHTKTHTEAGKTSNQRKPLSRVMHCPVRETVQLNHILCISKFIFP